MIHHWKRNRRAFEQLKEKAVSFQRFSLTVDESSDVTQHNLVFLFKE